MSEQSEEKRSRKGVSGLGIPAGLLVGLGIGMVMDQTAAGVLIGLGGGFIITMITRIIIGEW